MRPLRALWNRLAVWWRGPLSEADMEDEFAFHLEMEARKLVATGMSAGEAASAARRRFGNHATGRQLAREGAGTSVVYDALADLRHAVRQLLRRPGYSALGIFTLALGLGATVALGSVVRSVLVRPLPVSDEASVQVFWSSYNWRGVEFDFLAERTRAFSSLAAYSNELTALETDGANVVVQSAVVSAGLFDLLGAAPLLGRTFRAGEDRPGSEPTAVLSHGLWRERFAGDPDIVGRRVTLSGVPTTVIGVMPADFWFPTPEDRLWTPLDLDPASGMYQGNGWLVLMGRTAPGVTPARMQEDVVAMARALGERFEYPAAWDKTRDPSITPLRTYLVGDMGPGLLLLFGAGGLILVMACANVAALVLARTTDRTHEIALRAALGAGRGRLARQIVAEAIALAVVAGVVGAALAAGGFRLLVASLPLTGGLGQTVRLDWTAFVFGALLAVVVGLFVAAAPVRDLLRGRLQGLGSTRGVRGPGRRTGRFHASLVAAEAAVAVTLVVGAALLIRSVDRLYSLDLGFDTDGVMAVDLYAGTDDLDNAARLRFYSEVVNQAAGVPGVRSAGLVARLPVRDGGWQGTVTVEDNPDLQGAAAPNAMFRPVTPAWFRTMGIRVLSGRALDDTDREGGVLVGVVSESFAARAWPGLDPIGRRYRTGALGRAEWITVVGVVEDISVASITGDNPPVHYLALAQMREAPRGMVLVLRGGNGVVGPVRDLVRRLEPRVAVGRVASMESVVATALAEPLRLRFFLSLFAALALVLGVVGVYSVVSYSVARRQGEFGVRMALGAAGATVAGQVVQRGLLPVVVGTLAGIVASLLLGRLAARFLYGVSPADPLSIALAAAALLTAGIVASVIPAWRASRVSPVDALRAE